MNKEFKKIYLLMASLVIITLVVNFPALSREMKNGFRSVSDLVKSTFNMAFAEGNAESSSTNLHDCETLISKSGPSSSQYNPNAKWSSVFIGGDDGNYGDINHLSQFLDINGDGLADYIYNDHYVNMGTYDHRTCVYLNNGSGWDMVFKCQEYRRETWDSVKGAVNVYSYKGDCAL